MWLLRAAAVAGFRAWQACRLIATSALELTANGQEKTALRFQLDATGKLVADSLNSVFRPLRSAK